MATTELDVILRALWKGQGIREAKRDLEVVGSTSKRSANTMKDAFSLMAKTAAAGGAAVFAFKKAFDFAKEGAELQRVESQLDSLALSIGSTKDAIIDDLGEATKGMMSNADMMASASQIISLGLGTTHDDVISLATLVSELGWDMQQVILTFANNSKARLDALGLSVTDVEGRMKALEKQGYDTDRAFDMAVIEAGRDKLELLGSAADGNLGKFKRFEAAVDDAKAIMQEYLVMALLPVIEGLTWLIKGHERVAEAEEAQRMTMEKLALSTGSFAEFLAKVRENDLFFSGGDRELRMWFEYHRALLISGSEAERLNEQMGRIAARREHLRKIRAGIGDIAIGMRDVRTGAEEAVWATKQFGEEGAQALIPLAEEVLPELRGAWEAVFGAEATAKTNLQDYLDVILGQETHEARERALGIAYAWGKITEEEYNAALAALNAEEVHNRVVENMEKLVGPLRDRWGEAAAAAYSYREALLALEGLGPGGVVVTPVGGGTGSSPHPTVGDPTGRQGSPGPRTGTYGGGGAGVTPQAHGGPVSWGRPYMVGERGPELFVPSRSGTIVPNGGGAGNTYQIFMGGGMALEFTGRVSGGYMADKLAVAR